MRGVLAKGSSKVGEKLMAEKRLPGRSVSARATSKTKGNPSSSTETLRYQERRTPYHCWNRARRESDPTRPSTVGEGARDCSLMASRRRGTAWGSSWKWDSLETDGNRSHTALALAVPLRPRNWRTNSRRGRSRLPWRAWAMWQKTRRVSSSGVYHQGEVESVGRNLVQPSEKEARGW